MIAPTPQPTACRECDGSRVVPAEYTSGRTLTVFAWPCPLCCCGICGEPYEYPPQCRDCAGREEAAAKRRGDLP